MFVLLATLNAILPSFVLMFCGWIVRRTHLVSENFLTETGRIVFYLALPTLVVLKFYEVDTTQALPMMSLVICAAATTSFCIIAWIVARTVGKTSADIGALFQGSTRTNFAVIGLYLIQSMFGHEGLLNATLFLVVTIPINNISSVVSLSYYEATTGPRKKSQWKDILLNPMILSLAFLPIIWFKPNIPDFLLRALHDVASLSLPLALIAIGSSIRFSSLKDHLKLGGIGLFMKLVAMPAFVVGISLIFGIRGLDLVSIALFSATPTATASDILAKRYKSNVSLTGWMIAATTLGSLITLPLIITALRVMHLIP
ncbi:AEC family transporter [bacterium]|nr:AEC family transporter [bacterium]